MTTPIGPILSLWEVEGNRNAATFDSFTSAVVIGDDPAVAAEVALGIARVQARRRRVAVADTVGELPPLEDLVPIDAPYGIVDSFFYGVSLNKIAYTVDPARNLIIFPSGTAPIDHDALLGSDRWPKLVDAFRSAEGLLLIVAPAGSSALPSLIGATDGLVLVGDVASVPNAKVLAHARLDGVTRLTPPSMTAVPPFVPEAVAPAPPPSPPRKSYHDTPESALSVEDPEEELAPMYAEAREESPSPGVDEDQPETREAHDASIPVPAGPELVPPWAREGEFPGRPPSSLGAKTVSFWVAIAAGVFIVAGLLTWVNNARRARSDALEAIASHADTAHPLSASGTMAAVTGPSANSTAAPDSAPSVTATSSAPETAPPTAPPVPPPATSVPAPFSVVLADMSSLTSASGEIDQAAGRGFPDVTFAPYPRDGRLSYVVMSGAFADSSSADSLLRAVRAKRYRTAAAAHVVRLPYAVHVLGGVARDQAPMFVRAYLAKGLPVYPLLQPDGSASLWAGAFRTAEQAEPLAASFRKNGDEPSVMIRTGRSF